MVVNDPAVVLRERYLCGKIIPLCGAYAVLMRGSVRKYMSYAELMRPPSKVADTCEWACAPHVCMKMYHGPWTMVRRPWPMERSIDHGPWTMVHGPWSMDHGLWTMVHGPWSTDHGLRTMVHGPWSMDHGPWTMVYGPWSMDHCSVLYPNTPNMVASLRRRTW